jgi:hypothetical protein
MWAKYRHAQILKAPLEILSRCGEEGLFLGLLAYCSGFKGEKMKPERKSELGCFTALGTLGI